MVLGLLHFILRDPGDLAVPPSRKFERVEELLESIPPSTGQSARNSPIINLFTTAWID